MTSLITTTLDHLEALVAFDTQNPPRRIGTDGIFEYLSAQLAGFDCALTDHGDGCVSLLAVRGRPDTVFNFHLDTVPASAEWRGDPLRLEIDDERATGLGACDIKGAAACMLAACQSGDGDLALLFTSDEEAGAGVCVKEFLKRDHGFSNAVVAEPTGGRAVFAHRGIATATLEFTGEAGHASGPGAVRSSALHRAARWANRSLDFAEEREHDTFGDLSGIRFNIGKLEGGVKPNVVAARARVDFGVRPLPGVDGRRLLETLRDLSRPQARDRFAIRFVGPSLPAGDPHEVTDAAALARRFGLPAGAPVDFWTEAALFAAAGMTAIVFGPGDIAQAHTANEWVAHSQLATAAEAYRTIIKKSEKTHA